MNPWDEVDMRAEQTMEETVLKKIRYTINQKVSRQLWDSIEIDSYVEMIAGEIVLRVEGHVYGEQRKRVITYPRGWWQAFKEQYFFGWLLSKFPVKYTEVEVNFDITYPDFEHDDRLGQVVVHSFVRERNYE